MTHDYNPKTDCSVSVPASIIPMKKRNKCPPMQPFTNREWGFGVISSVIQFQECRICPKTQTQQGWNGSSLSHSFLYGPSLLLLSLDHGPNAKSRPQEAPNTPSATSLFEKLRANTQQPAPCQLLSARQCGSLSGENPQLPSHVQANFLSVNSLCTTVLQSNHKIIHWSRRKSWLELALDRPSCLCRRHLPNVANPPGRMLRIPHPMGILWEWTWGLPWPAASHHIAPSLPPRVSQSWGRQIFGPGRQD